MSIILVILIALIAGIVSGVLSLAPAVVSSNMDTLILVMLCLLLFVIGLDMSQNKTVFAQLKRIGLKMVLLPVFIAIGSICGAFAAGLIMGMDAGNATAIGAGFGWYSLSAVMLTGLVGAQVGTMALLSNVVR
jgi:uncharacterized membrane protein YbjE (DUF340 family)